MSFATISRRPRAIGGLARPDNRSENMSPRINCCLPVDLFERLADDAAALGVPVSQLIREALRLKYPELLEVVP